MPVATLIDTLGVQEYVFRSNRLRDVVGASQIVRDATQGTILIESLPHGIKPLISAGGNTVLEFNDLDSARAFAGYYSRLLFDKARGLRVVVTHQAHESGGLRRALQALFEAAEERKRFRPAEAVQGGISVTASCAITAEPAVGLDKDRDNQAIAAVVASWRSRDTQGQVDERWKAYLPAAAPEHKASFTFPQELDKLGRTRGERSDIAIVHIDCNSIGALIRKRLAKHVGSDEDLRTKYKTWSSDLETRLHTAFRAAVTALRGAVTWNNGRPSIEGISLAVEEQEVQLPIRPIVLGGDDLTFVCDARLAHALTAQVLGSLQAQNSKSATNSTLGAVGACAGIAVIGAHEPLVRGYRLAKQLCTNAKNALHRSGLPASRCLLDWHLGQEHAGAEFVDMRQAVYRTASATLTCRPYLLGDSGTEDKPVVAQLLNWRWFSRKLLEETFQREWSESRNKAKALAQTLHKGPSATREWLEATRARLPKLKLPEFIGESGFLSDGNGPRTPLLDALELLDLYTPLNAVEVSK